MGTSAVTITPDQPPVIITPDPTPSGLGMSGASLTRTSAVPNARLRNLPNPAAEETSALGALYHGAKTGATLGMLPAAAAAVPTTIPAAIGTGTGIVGGAALGTGAKAGAEALGAGELGQEAAGDVGSVAGGILGAGLGEGAANAFKSAASKARALWDLIPAETQKSLQKKTLDIVPGVKTAKNALGLEKDFANVLDAIRSGKLTPPPAASAPSETASTGTKLRELLDELNPEEGVTPSSNKAIFKGDTFEHKGGQFFKNGKLLDKSDDIADAIDALEAPRGKVIEGQLSPPKLAQTTGNLTPQGWYYLGRLQEIARNIDEEEAAAAPKNITTARAAKLTKPVVPPASTEDLSPVLQEMLKRVTAAKGKLSDLQ